jgi:hypothetical protein
MARRPSKHVRPARPLGSGSFASVAVKADGEWMVQSMPVDRSNKSYTCPGCDLTVSPGTAHVVAWPRHPSIGSASAVAERRHWHTACWQRRR